MRCQDPAWTKASCTAREMLEKARVGRARCIERGTRYMARWLWDYEYLKAAGPALSIITCHDE